MRITSVFICFLLTSLFPIASGQTTIRTKQKQVPADPNETKEIYVPGVRPLLWQNHGADPYFPIPNRYDLIRLSQKQGLIKDLAEQSFTDKQAEYIKKALENGMDPAQVSEVILPINTGIQNMRFGHGIARMVIVRGQAVPAWQIILPPELGSLTVWIAKICGNICTSVARAQSQHFIYETTIEEREKIKIVEKNVPIIVERPVFIERPVYIKNESRCGKRCKILIGSAIGAAIVIGIKASGNKSSSPPILSQPDPPYKPPGGGGGVN